MAQRSASLRTQSPEQTIATLQDILREALHVQSSGSAFFADRALKELKQIRQDMTAGQINAGSRTAQISGTYGHVIDQLESLTKNADKTQSDMGKTIDSIKNAFPSSDTLIGALMTANPVLGYGVKLFRDISRSRRAAKVKDNDERKRRLSVLEQQAEFIESQFDVVEEQKEVAQQQMDVVSAEKKEKRTRSYVYKPLLEDIKTEISELKSLISDAGTLVEVDQADVQHTDALNNINETITNNNKNISTKLTRVDAANDKLEDNVVQLFGNQQPNLNQPDLQRISVNEEIQDGTEDLIRVNEDGTDRIVDAVNALSDNQEKEAARQRRKEKLERSRLTVTPYSSPSHVESNAVSEGKGSPFLGLLAALRGLGMLGILGTGAGLLTALVSPIKALFSLVGTLGSMLLKLGSKLLLPAAIIGSIYKFFEGFFEADKIIGKNDSQISTTERIVAGVSNLLSSIVNMVDGLLEWTGYDVIDTEGLTKKIFDFFMSIPEKVSSMIDAITVSMSNAYDKAVGSVVSVYDEVVDSFKELYNTITGKIDKWIEDFNNMSLYDWLFSDTENTNDSNTPMFGDNMPAGEIKAFDYESPEYKDTVKTQYENYGRGFGEISGSMLERNLKTKEIDDITAQAIATRIAKEQQKAIAVNAPTANVTSVNNTIMQERNTGNMNPRLKLAQ